MAFHRSADYVEIGRFDDSITYNDYLADFSADLHDLRNAPEFASSLASDSYVASQGLAETLLAAGSLGVVYPSVRDVSGTCLACFRPALVNNVRKVTTWRFTWAGTPEPQIEIEHQRHRRRRRQAGWEDGISYQTASICSISCGRTELVFSSFADLL